MYSLRHVIEEMGFEHCDASTASSNDYNDYSPAFTFQNQTLIRYAKGHIERQAFAIALVGVRGYVYGGCGV